jgi:hypothetical protein
MTLVRISKVNPWTHRSLEVTQTGNQDCGGESSPPKGWMQGNSSSNEWGGAMDGGMGEMMDLTRYLNLDRPDSSKWSKLCWKMKPSVVNGK